MNEVFRKSLPFFEQAHAIDPTDRTYIQILKGLYYRFHDSQKEAEMKALLETL